MKLEREKTERVERSVPFVVSGWVHGFLLAWVALSPPQGPRAPRSAYEQEIEPHEKRIIWYNVRDRLPDISPVAPRKSGEPPRAREKFDQTIVAGSQDLPGPKQLISMAAPEIKTPDALPLPNVVGTSPPSPKAFTVPTLHPRPLSVPVLPDAPRVTQTVDARNLPIEDRNLKPAPRAFKAPPKPQPKATDPAALPDAPTVSAAVHPEDLPLNVPERRAPPRSFTPPPGSRPKPVNPSALPDAPPVTAAVEGKKLPLATADPRAPLRSFTPPPANKRKASAVGTVELPDAPTLSASVHNKNLPLATADPKAPPRSFTPPPARSRMAAQEGAADLSEAPTVSSAVQGKSLPLATSDLKAPPRSFTPPPSRARKPAQTGGAALPDAPAVTAAVQGKGLPLATPDPKAPLRSFTPPPTGAPNGTRGAAQGDLPAAPEVQSPLAPVTPEVSLAIVGIHPAKVPDFPTPPGSRPAGFSAGPEVRPKGSDSATGESGSSIVVPGLLVRGGPKDAAPTLIADMSATSRENLVAAARTALGMDPAPAGAAAHESHATRVSSAPDPRLEGRAIYTVAIQMPNVTSYSGSWIVWFADREPEPGSASREVRAPVPLRKVDPKYIAAAAAEKVEGTVRLFAVIRKDGHVESVALARHLDDRLDHSAQEALAQWVFQPATLDGHPIDVDAVFEIPFRLAPKVDR